MSVKVEEVKNTKIAAKGILRQRDANGFSIEDEKSGEVEILSFDDIDALLNKSVAITFVNKEELD